MKPGNYVVLGNFKLKHWYVSTGVDEITHLLHKGCPNSLGPDVDGKSLEQIMELIANHECTSD